MAWEIISGSDVYYVVVFEMDDPSCGLFGYLGSWTPYQTVLYNSAKEPISKHSETNMVDHVRITSCSTAETMIRHLTLWGMIDSCYKSEIIRINEEIRDCYKTVLKTRDRLLELYGKREAADPMNDILLHNIRNFAYEKLLEYN